MKEKGGKRLQRVFQVKINLVKLFFWYSVSTFEVVDQNQ